MKKVDVIPIVIHVHESICIQLPTLLKKIGMNANRTSAKTAIAWNCKSHPPSLCCMISKTVSPLRTADVFHHTQQNKAEIFLWYNNNNFTKYEPCMTMLICLFM